MILISKITKGYSVTLIYKSKFVCKLSFYKDRMSKLFCISIDTLKHYYTINNNLNLSKLF